MTPRSGRSSAVDTAGLMQGFPPPPEAQVTLENWRTSPFNRWAFHHVRELLPTAEIQDDPGRVRPLERAALDLSGITIESREGRLDLAGFCAAADVDGLVVLHRGRLAHESYLNGMKSGTPHILMSVSKSMLGLLAGILVERGLLEPEAQVARYVPEVRSTAFEDATVRQLLDMRTGVAFNEDYSEADGLYQRYRKAMGWNPREPGEEPSDQRGFFRLMTGREGPHGGPFRYISPCSDLLGWIFERASGLRYAGLVSELLWQPLGAEAPAYITVDRLGAPRAAGGMCTTTRDLARVGQMIAEGGRGIVPADWIDDIARDGDAEAWDASDFAPEYPGMPMHYRAQWYVIRDRGPLIMASGIHGQNLLIDLGSGLVLAKHASAATPTDATGERLTLKLFAAIRDAIR